MPLTKISFNQKEVKTWPPYLLKEQVLWGWVVHFSIPEIGTLLLSHWHPGLNPKLDSENAGSKIGDRIWAMACWISRSRTVGMPSGRVPPFALGISTRLTGEGWYLPVKSACRIWVHRGLVCSGNCSMETPSTPGAPWLAFTRFQASAMFSLDRIRSSRFSFGSNDSITRLTGTPPCGFIRLQHSFAWVQQKMILSFGLKIWKGVYDSPVYGGSMVGRPE